MEISILSYILGYVNSEGRTQGFSGESEFIDKALRVANDRKKRGKKGCLKSLINQVGRLNNY